MKRGLKRLVIIGGPGSGQIAASVFEAVNLVKPEWIIEGFLNDVLAPGDQIGRYPVLGPTVEMAEYVRRGFYLHYTLHCTSRNKAERVNRFKGFKIPLEAMASAIHPNAVVDPSTTLGHGVLFAPLSATSINVHIGNYVHAYPHSYIAHDTTVGDFVTLTAHAIIGSRVRVGEGVQFGLNCCVRENLEIGAYALIGMGAVVLKDVIPHTIMYGNPASVHLNAHGSKP